MAVRTNIINNINIPNAKNNQVDDEKVLKLLSSFVQNQQHVDAHVVQTLQNGNAIILAQGIQLEIKNANASLSKGDKLILKALVDNNGNMLINVTSQNLRQVNKYFGIITKIRSNSLASRNQLNPNQTSHSYKDDFNPIKSIIGKHFSVKMILNNPSKNSSENLTDHNRILKDASIVIRNISSGAKVDYLERFQDIQYQIKELSEVKHDNVSRDLNQMLNERTRLEESKDYIQPTTDRKSFDNFKLVWTQEHVKSTYQTITSSIANADEIVHNELKNNFSGTIIGYSEDGDVILKTDLGVIEINGLKNSVVKTNYEITFQFVEKPIIINSVSTPFIPENIRELVDSFNQNYVILSHIMRNLQNFEWDSMQKVISELKRTYSKATYSIRNSKKSIKDLNKIMNMRSVDVTNMFDEYNSHLSNLKNMLPHEGEDGWITVNIPQTENVPEYQISVKEERFLNNKDVHTFFRVTLDKLYNVGLIVLDGVLRNTKNKPNPILDITIRFDINDYLREENFTKDLENLFSMCKNVYSIEGEIKFAKIISAAQNTNIDLNFRI